MGHGRLPAALAGALALIVPVAAHGAAVSPIKPCYVSVDKQLREQVALTGSGFTPGAVLDISRNGEVRKDVLADANGAFGPVAVTAPYVPKGVEGFAVTVAERDNPANAVESRALVTALSLRWDPTPRRPRQRVTWQGRGYTGEGRVYAHYVRNGKHRRTVRLGRPTGLCGTLKVKRPQFPFTPGVGRWMIRVDQEPKWSQMPDGVFYRFRVRVARAG